MTRALFLAAVVAMATVATCAPPPWQPPRGFAYTMTVHLVVEAADGTPLGQTENAQLAAFRNGEMRGLVSALNGPAGWWFQLAVSSNEQAEEDFELKVYEPSTDSVYKVELRLDFERDTTVGTIIAPIRASSSECPGLGDAGMPDDMDEDEDESSERSHHHRHGDDEDEDDSSSSSSSSHHPRHGGSPHRPGFGGSPHRPHPHPHPHPHPQRPDNSPTDPDDSSPDGSPTDTDEHMPGPPETQGSEDGDDDKHSLRLFASTHMALVIGALALLAFAAFFVLLSRRRSRAETYPLPLAGDDSDDIMGLPLKAKASTKTAWGAGDIAENPYVIFVPKQLPATLGSTGLEDTFVFPEVIKPGPGSSSV